MNMKKLIISLCMLVGIAVAGNAQKFAMVDMEYIMKNIPAFETANEQLTQISKKWQSEVEAQMQEVQNMYKSQLMFFSRNHSPIANKKLMECTSALLLPMRLLAEVKERCYNLILQHLWNSHQSSTKPNLIDSDFLTKMSSLDFKMNKDFALIDLSSAIIVLENNMGVHPKPLSIKSLYLFI